MMITIALGLFQVKAQESKPMDWQGHRGCRGLYPENTISAMIAAIQLGVTTLELDVVITKDQQVVLSHEPFMAHEISTSPEGKHHGPDIEQQFNIYQMNYEEVKRWDVGLKPHPRFPEQVKIPAYKPLLSELIDSVECFIRKHNLPPVQYNIETKCIPEGDLIFHPKPSEFIDLLWKVIREKNIHQRVTVQSFDKRTLLYCRKQKLPFRLSYLLEESDTKTIRRQIAALGFKPDIVSPEFSRIDRHYVRYCHNKGIKVIPWTVNDPAAISRLIEMDVDGIISDYPNLFLDFRNFN